MANYYGLGSSMGGCGVPSDKDRFSVRDWTSGGNSNPYRQGSAQGGYYYSPYQQQSGQRYMIIDGKKVAF